jgi:hypothetical protein
MPAHRIAVKETAMRDFMEFSVRGDKIIFYFLRDGLIQRN